MMVVDSFYVGSAISFISCLILFIKFRVFQKSIEEGSLFYPIMQLIIVTAFSWATVVAAVGFVCLYLIFIFEAWACRHEINFKILTGRELNNKKENIE